MDLYAKETLLNDEIENISRKRRIMNIDIDNLISKRPKYRSECTWECKVGQRWLFDFLEGCIGVYDKYGHQGGYSDKLEYPCTLLKTDSRGNSIFRTSDDPDLNDYTETCHISIIDPEGKSLHELTTNSAQSSYFGLAFVLYAFFSQNDHIILFDMAAYRDNNHECMEFAVLTPDAKLVRHGLIFDSFFRSLLLQ